MYHLPADGNPSSFGEGAAKTGSGISAIFVARNRFAVLERGGRILIKDLDNNITKELKPSGDITEIFFAGGKNILLASATAVTLYDTESKAAVGEVAISGARYISWSSDQAYVAIISKHSTV